MALGCVQRGVVLPQFVTASVHVPPCCPAAVAGGGGEEGGQVVAAPLTIVAVNCLTAFLALLACGARTSAPVRSRIEAENESRPRHERPDFDKDMAGPPLFRTRATLARRPTDNQYPPQVSDRQPPGDRLVARMEDTTLMGPFSGHSAAGPNAPTV
jgi:hypothetical protein